MLALSRLRSYKVDEAICLWWWSGAGGLGLLELCRCEKSIKDRYERRKTHTTVTSALGCTKWVPLQRMCVLVVLLFFQPEGPMSAPHEPLLQTGTDGRRGPNGQVTLSVAELGRDRVSGRRLMLCSFGEKNYCIGRSRRGKRNLVINWIVQCQSITCFTGLASVRGYLRVALNLSVFQAASRSSRLKSFHLTSPAPKTGATHTRRRRRLASDAGKEGICPGRRLGTGNRRRRSTTASRGQQHRGLSKWSAGLLGRLP